VEVLFRSRTDPQFPRTHFAEVPSMQYSLFPFASLNGATGPDLVGQLRARGSAVPATGPSNLDLLEELTDLLRGVPWQVCVDYCEEDAGDLRLAVVAPKLGRDVEKGDRVQAGLFIQNSESGAFPAQACERVYRVVCENGYMLECEQTQSVRLVTGAGADWRPALARVVDRSFAAAGLDRDVARFRATTEQMLTTPYELLCNLVAQKVLSEDEQAAVQTEFDEVGDYTLYGLINAVTRIAGRCRDFDDWKRSVELEHLGGAILRGDHQPPVLSPVFA
jgi:hypothetical protein